MTRLPGSFSTGRHSMQRASVCRSPAHASVQPPRCHNPAMGCGSSSPPPYDGAPAYENRAQLLWALSVLSSPPRDVVEWQLAYDVAAVSIAHAHQLTPCRASCAMQRPGLIALAATQSWRLVKGGARALSPAFAR